jgi:hypothetical protein
MAAAYVDLGDDAASLAFETSFAPVGVYYAQHAQELGRRRDPLGDAEARKEGGGEAGSKGGFEFGDCRKDRNILQGISN